MADVTGLLERWRQGERAALDELMPLVYDELHRLAGAYLRNERSNHTLQPTALVNEAYVRLTSVREAGFANRVHFYGAAATAMRRILVEHARRRGAQKRGDGASHVALEDAVHEHSAVPGPTKLRLRLPAEERTAAEVIGEGPDAAAAVVDLLERIGVIGR